MMINQLLSVNQVEMNNQPIVHEHMWHDWNFTGMSYLETSINDRYLHLMYIVLVYVGINSEWFRNEEQLFLHNMCQSGSQQEEEAKGNETIIVADFQHKTGTS